MKTNLMVALSAVALAALPDLVLAELLGEQLLPRTRVVRERREHLLRWRPAPGATAWLTGDQSMRRPPVRHVRWVAAAVIAVVSGALLPPGLSAAGGRVEVTMLQPPAALPDAAALSEPHLAIASAQETWSRTTHYTPLRVAGGQLWNRIRGR